MNCVFAWMPKNELKTYFESKISNEIKLTFVDNNDEKYFLEVVETAEILVGWKFTLDILKRAEKLKCIINPGAGVQHISKEIRAELKARKIIFCNSHSNAIATAQHAFALLLSLTNKIILHHNFLKNGNWRTGDKEGKSISLNGKIVGLLGFGKIGQQVFKMLSGVNCKFMVYKNSNKVEEEFKNKVEVYANEDDNLNTFLSKCDVLICTLPSTEKTKNIINSNNISFLRKNCLLINVGRGDVVEEQAIFTALKENKIAGAAIDVWYNYRPEEIEGKKYPFNFDFHKLENIVLSPHRAASPLDDPLRYEDEIFNINECLKPNPQLKNVIDFERGY